MAAHGLGGELAAASEQAAQEARPILVGLRQGQLDRPTVDVVREILDNWSAETGVAPSSQWSAWSTPIPPSPSQLAAALQEMLHNIAKHAEATPGRGGADRRRRRSGAGRPRRRGRLRPAPRPAWRGSGHFGLRGLHERAAQVGGAMQIDSIEGEGTTIRWTATRQPIPA